MSKELVFITGTTGHIGFRVLVEVLRAGYKVRIGIRKAEQFEKIKTAKSIAPYTDHLEYVVVPDITASGAYDKALDGIDYVLHLASPLIDPKKEIKDAEKEYFYPASEGTLNMLRAAKDSTTIKRIVVTSSVVILAPKEGASSIPPESLRPKPDPDNIDNSPWGVYRASKLYAYYAAREWMEKNKPKWDCLEILPAYVQGGNELTTDAADLAKGSNDIMMDLILGKKSDTPQVAGLVFLADVAKVHAAILDTSKGKDGDRFVAAYPKKITWDQVIPLAEKHFPDAFRSGILSKEGKQASMEVVYDSSSTTKLFGIEFQGLEAMVVDTIGQYVELKQKEAK